MHNQCAAPSCVTLPQAKLLRDIDSVVAVVIALKTHYPRVDIANIIKRKPKLLLSTQQRVEQDAQKVKLAAALHCVVLWKVLSCTACSTVLCCTALCCTEPCDALNFTCAGLRRSHEQSQPSSVERLLVGHKRAQPQLAAQQAAPEHFALLVGCCWATPYRSSPFYHPGFKTLMQSSMQYQTS